MNILGGILRGLKIAGQIGLVASGADSLITGTKDGEVPEDGLAALLDQAETIAGIEFVDEDLFAMGLALMLKGVQEKKKRKIIQGNSLMASAFIIDEEEEPDEENPEINPAG